MEQMELLKLVALDRDDLEVVSTHLQDAVVCVGDVYWRPTEKRLVISLARFDWEGAVGASREFQRFDRVTSVKCKNVDCTNKQAILNLLAVEFEETDSPAGVVTLTFSGEAVARLEVECLECELADLGPVWATTCCPTHADDVRTA
jgi:hypothetical protein